MKNLLFLLILFCGYGVFAQTAKGEILPREIQVKTALLPISESDAANAMVYGYEPNGKLVVLRESRGGNMVCLADDPNKEGISVSCYAQQLEPFMKRGRELRALGKDVQNIREIRGREIEQGKLFMPKEPSMMYVYYGKEENYDTNTGDLAHGEFRYVIYIPYATTQSTGLPDKPHAKGMPWLMDPGTHRAHIMVGPN